MFLSIYQDEEEVESKVTTRDNRMGVADNDKCSSVRNECMLGGGGEKHSQDLELL